MAQDRVKKGAGKFELLVIGGSAGSLSMVQRIIPLLKDEMEIAVIIIFHRKQTDDNMLVDVLSTKTGFLVKEAEDKDIISHGVIYLAPADYHLLVERERSITLDDSERVNFSRPSIDVSFESAADVYGPSMICMLLSGANADGVSGMMAAQKAGAYIVIQDPVSAEVAFMPREAINNVNVDLILKDSNFDEFVRLLNR
jgi:two-component system chemotaxis response regulator CheB